MMSTLCRMLLVKHNKKSDKEVVIRGPGRSRGGGLYLPSTTSSRAKWPPIHEELLESFLQLGTIISSL